MNEWILDDISFQGRAFMRLIHNSHITRHNSQGKSIVPLRTHHNCSSGMNSALDPWSPIDPQQPSSAFFIVEREWTTYWSVVQVSSPETNSSTHKQFACGERKTGVYWYGMHGQSQGHASLWEDTLPRVTSTVTVSVGITFLFHICQFQWPRAWL